MCHRKICYDTRVQSINTEPTHTHTPSASRLECSAEQTNINDRVRLTKSMPLCPTTSDLCPPAKRLKSNDSRYKALYIIRRPFDLPPTRPPTHTHTDIIPTDRPPDGTTHRKTTATITNDPCTHNAMRSQLRDPTTDACRQRSTTSSSASRLPPPLELARR